MHRIIASLVLLCASFFLAPRPVWAVVTIQWSPVGNPGNANDPADGDRFTPGIQNFGAVPYAYNIAKYDVTNSQYVEFLNAKDASGLNTLGLYNIDMSNGGHIFANGGINYNAGNASGSKYSVISGNGNHPVNNVTWYDAIRFANWLNNGQGSGDTETGAYTILGGTPTPSNGNSITRNAGAKIVLPNENEWYKAAYYNPGTHSYFQYPTGSNSTPGSDFPTALPNRANIRFTNPFQPTDVGAYTGTTSPYGAFDMGGNVFQWNDTGGSFRGKRGAAFYSISDTMLSSSRFFDDARLRDEGVGFRVAMVPEPSTALLAVIACGMMWVLRKRFK